MTPEKEMKDELLVRLCCGDRCMSGVGVDDREGGCECWTYSEEADAILADAENEASAKLIDISKRLAPGRQWLYRT
ncbi:hypothetical protein [Sinorhizobium meliloti]|uniref:hypothetical protein n=1 Tax=Rhizobium meliloti TaxID=382 RepID=UPI0002861569|nr:hypothetical protein [Sinorhizobium meliloti]MDW9644452.1 hypothetical protein [Sinorhizobium meliloti]MQW17304.1 hypothetical protein [Sinorhizobium meliloti]MQX02811.1 hypothetical protein [Sinorhizobium meliloti]RVK52069.1 hypothetical protein CN160_09135 [Sinorhizobium meliloti]CCM66822.1 hypothetical protein BN406_00777 [Sinorhizobium meliloti Rm41]